MKILWHMPTLGRHTCGLSIRALRLAAELRRFGHDVTFTVAADRTDITEAHVEGMELERLDVPAAATLHWSLQAAARRNRARGIVRRLSRPHDVFLSCQPEVIHAYRHARHSARPGLPLRGRPVGRFGSTGVAPTLCVFVCGGTTLLHDAADRADQAGRPVRDRLCFAVDRRLKRRNECAGFAAADAVVFDSHHTRLRVVRTYGVAPEKCVTVHGGVDADVFRPAGESERAAARASLAVAPDARVLTWTGRISPEKNLPLLVRALGRCNTPPARVFIVGDGPARDDLARLCRRERVEDIVSIVGPVADVRPYLHAADGFVFPSRSESFGGALVEAMACGLPVIVLAAGATARNASEEILGDAACGVAVPRDEPAAFARAIDALLADPRRRRRRGRRAARRARERFTWTRAGQRLHAVLRGAFERSGRRRSKRDPEQDAVPARSLCAAGRGCIAIER